MSLLRALSRYFGALAGALIVIVFGVSACWNTVYPTNSFRYRLTVVVETPEGLRTGSGVVEATARSQPAFGSASSVLTTAKGEAVTVDLGARGLLFVLLKGNRENEHASSAGSIVYYVFPTARGGGEALPENVRRYQEQTLSARLTLAQMPLMVRFRDPLVPASVERVDPANLAASFGAGVRLRDVTLATTRDPVTSGIVKWLPWAAGPPQDTYLDGQKTSDLRTFANILHQGHFRRDW